MLTISVSILSPILNSSLILSQGFVLSCFKLKNNLEDQSTLLEINNQIKEIGFERTAIKYSMSSTSLDGGKIGWISSKALSKKILIILDKMEIGDISEPIIQTDIATIIKLLDKKTTNLNDIDLDELRKKIVNNKKNELLSLYSNNYLSKIKNNNNTGTVIITDPAIKYCLGTS